LTETPDFAAQSGLVDDAIRVPSFAPAHLAALTQRLHAYMAGLRALPWRTWSVDQQIDVRWVYANAERIDRELNVERLYRQRLAAVKDRTTFAVVAPTTTPGACAMRTCCPGRPTRCSPWRSRR
jgi:hypothetical protein